MLRQFLHVLNFYLYIYGTRITLDLPSLSPTVSLEEVSQRQCQQCALQYYI